MSNLKRFIAVTMGEYLNESIKTKFSVVPTDIFNMMRYRRYSDADNMDMMAMFSDKNNKEFIIIKVINRDAFEVYDIRDVRDAIVNGTRKPSRIAVAHFDINRSEKYFTGYTSNESITVDPKYRRLGIGTAIIDFAEDHYEMDYKPSSVLSTDMKSFVKNRFGDETT